MTIIADDHGIKAELQRLVYRSKFMHHWPALNMREWKVRPGSVINVSAKVYGENSISDNSGSFAGTSEFSCMKPSDPKGIEEEKEAYFPANFVQYDADAKSNKKKKGK